MIYYVDPNGNVTGAAGTNDINGITALHNAAYAVHIDDATVTAVTNNGAPGTLSIQNLTPAGVNQYGLPIATGTLAFAPVSSADLLQDAQNDKYAQIETNFAKAIQTFQSSALGATKTYLLDPTSWAMLSAQYAYAIGPDCTDTSINWYTVEDNAKVSHTIAQIRQVFIDGHAWVKAQEQHKDDLVAKAKAATTPDAVNAVASW